MDGRARGGRAHPHEHPQIIAIVLAYLDADQAAEVLRHLPAELRADVVARIATLDGVQPSALTELDDIIEKQFAGKSGGKTSALGGAKAAAEHHQLPRAEPGERAHGADRARATRRSARASRISCSCSTT